MCNNKISNNVVKYTRAITRRLRTIKKIRESKIKKKFTYKKREKYCPRLRQKKKNKTQEENLKKNSVKSFDFKTRDERKRHYDDIFKKNARNRKKNIFSKKVSNSGNSKYKEKYSRNEKNSGKAAAWSRERRARRCFYKQLLLKTSKLEITFPQ